MAHEMLSNDHMMSANNIRPWHGLGTVLVGLATASEALKAAKLDWTVKREPICLASDPNKIIVGSVANVRSDDGSILGIVSEGYKILQNIEAFQVFDAITKDPDAAIYETAGSMFGGSVTYITAKIPGLIQVGPKGNNDVSEKFLLVANTHDGSGAFRVKLVSTRVVCNNTLTAALREHGKTYSVRHTAKIQDGVNEATKILGLANAEFDEMGAAWNAMYKVKVDDAEVKAMLERSFEKPAAAKKRAKQAIDQAAQARMDALGLNDDKETEANKRAIRAIMEIYMTGASSAERSVLPDTGMKGIEGTAWGALNAVTYFTNHVRQSRVDKRTSNSREDNQLNGLLWGQSAELVDRFQGQIGELMISRGDTGKGAKELVAIGASAGKDAPAPAKKKAEK